MFNRNTKTIKNSNISNAVYHIYNQRINIQERVFFHWMPMKYLISTLKVSDLSKNYLKMMILWGSLLTSICIVS